MKFSPPVNPKPNPNHMYTLALALTLTSWENFKHAPLLQLTTLKLNDNALAWDQKMFNEQIAMLKEKKLKHISLENNPFVDEVGWG